MRNNLVYTCRSKGGGGFLEGKMSYWICPDHASVTEVMITYNGIFHRLNIFDYFYHVHGVMNLSETLPLPRIIIGTVTSSLL